MAVFMGIGLLLKHLDERRYVARTVKQVNCYVPEQVEADVFHSAMVSAWTWREQDDDRCLGNGQRYPLRFSRP
jgi:hypothetical protein